MIEFVLILLCIGAGVWLRHRGVLEAGAARGINTWILYVALPAVALRYVPHIRWGEEVLLAVAMPVVVWVGAWAVVTVLTRRNPKVDRKTRAALILTSGLGNTSFLGFPLVAAYFGESYLGAAVVCDQVSFVVLSTAGVFTAMKASNGGTVSWGEMGGRLLRFPAFIALLAAFLLPPFVSLQPLEPLLDKLVATLVPLALFSVGLQLRLDHWRAEAGKLGIGLGYKLLVAPALVLGLALLAGMSGPVMQVAVFEASMAPMVTAGIMAEEYRLGGRTANLMVGVGIVLSFATTALWWLVLNSFG